MKKYQQFINEASLKGNTGIPGNRGNDSDPNYLNDVQQKFRQSNPGSPVNTDSHRPTQQEGMAINDLMRQMMEIAPQISRMQRGKEEELSELATKVIMHNYGSILDGVELDIKIVRPGSINMNDMNEDSDEQDAPPEYEKIEDEEIKKEVDRRKINNNIMQGEGKNSKFLLHTEESSEGLSEIFGEENGKKMIDLCDKITKIAQKIDWAIPPKDQIAMWKERPEGLAGRVKVEWEKKDKIEEEDDEEEYKEWTGEEEEDEETQEDDAPMESFTPRILVRAIDYAMCLHEAIKGVYELIAQKSTHEDQEIAKVVKLNADQLSDEVEDLRYGPYMAADLRDFINANPKAEQYPNMREIVFGALCDRERFPTDDFLELFCGILMKTPQARRTIDSLIDEIIESMNEYEAETSMDNSRNDDYYDDEDGDTMEEPKAKPVQKKVPETPKEPDYASMSPSEINSLIDDALDNDDMDTVRKLSQYVKESRGF